MIEFVAPLADVTEVADDVAAADYRGKSEDVVVVVRVVGSVL